MIDRCHRGGDRDFYKKKNKSRPVFAAMHKWEDCEAHVASARSGAILVNYKYGPKTTRRRNMALAERRKLKENGTITSAYVKYPAVLVGKKSRSDEYKVIKDFSKEDFQTLILI